MKLFNLPWPFRKKPADTARIEPQTLDDVESVDLDTGEVTLRKRPESVEGERSLPSVNKATSVRGRMVNIITVALIIFFAGLFLWRYYAAFLDRKQKAEATRGVDLTTQSAVVVPPLKGEGAADVPDGTSQKPSFDIPGMEEPPPPPEANRSPLGSTDGNHQSDSQQGTGAGTTQAGANGRYPDDGMNTGAGGDRRDRPLTPEERKKAAPVKFDFGGRTGSTEVDAATGSRQPGGEAQVGGEGGMEASLRPTYTPGVKATMLPDRDLFITKGTFLDCVMEPAIDTKVRGMVSCILSREVRGASGNVKLLDKGTKLTGEYRGEVKGNDARIFVLWSLAETPNGVMVELNSPGTDALGRAGVGGYVDDHFRERFSSAILISVIQDSAAAITGGNRQGNTTVVMPNTLNSGQNLAVEALKQDAAIENTLTKNQGAHISVYVSRHLDFRGVYKLERK